MSNNIDRGLDARPAMSGALLSIARGIVTLIIALPLQAQYLGDQYPGLTGLNAGSQPAPGVYVTIPLYLRESGISLFDAQGNKFARDVRANLGAWVLPSLAVTTPFKILGGTYGFSATQWMINGTLNLASAGIQRTSKYGYGDLYIQPATLGWRKPHFDATLGYAFFAPTGKGVSGTHMWVNEMLGGLTVRPDAQKKFNISTMAMYDFHHKKEDADITVGNILSMSGGAGRSFMNGLGNIGVAYFAQWKMTYDKGSDIPANRPITRGRLFTVGPEVSMPVFAHGRNLGIMSFRYEWPFGVKTGLGGQVLAASFTIARVAK